MDIKTNNQKMKVILVLSGKGGVGKSTVSANLAATLAQKGYKTGLLDVDIHGPSIPTLFGIDNVRPEIRDNKIIPYSYDNNLKIVSTAFFIDNQESPIIFRGPKKSGMIQQFIKEVDWGDLDYLVIDAPPGTGDEPLTVIQTFDSIHGAVVVTTPQKMATVDVQKSVNFLKTLNVPIIGVIENMSGFVCPHCQKTTEIFKLDGGKNLCEQMNIPFLGKIPLDPQVVDCSDKGRPFMLSININDINTTNTPQYIKDFKKIIDSILSF
ncbi:MAG: Mrp/NBP35 family ATP-binding protein [Oligoflexia bacterium]|nr:Mrp/NBP35 family ATP-binding protein [Oligoflexia bacterium]